MSLLSLPIRLASPPREASATQGTLQNAPAFEADAGPEPRPSIAENANGPVSHVSMSELTAGATATGPSSHQFWLKDAKIAEDLFTVRFPLKRHPPSRAFFLFSFFFFLRRPQFSTAVPDLTSIDTSQCQAPRRVREYMTESSLLAPCHRGSLHPL